MKLTALKTFRHGATVFRRGHPVEMSEAQAKPLLAKKFVEGAASKASGSEDLSKLTNKQLHDLAAVEGIAVESDDNKASLVDKIATGRAAKG